MDNFRIVLCLSYREFAVGLFIRESSKWKNGNTSKGQIFVENERWSPNFQRHIFRLNASPKFSRAMLFLNLLLKFKHDQPEVMSHTHLTFKIEKKICTIVTKCLFYDN